MNPSIYVSTKHFVPWSTIPVQSKLNNSLSLVIPFSIWRKKTPRLLHISQSLENTEQNFWTISLFNILTQIHRQVLVQQIFCQIVLRNVPWLTKLPQICLQEIMRIHCAWASAIRRDTHHTHWNVGTWNQKRHTRHPQKSRWHVCTAIDATRCYHRMQR